MDEFLLFGDELTQPEMHFQLLHDWKSPTHTQCQRTYYILAIYLPKLVLSLPWARISSSKQILAQELDFSSPFFHLGGETWTSSHHWNVSLSDIHLFQAWPIKISHTLLSILFTLKAAGTWKPQDESGGTCISTSS